ncbi:MAG TPA: acyl-CoA synthetase, partial [Ilumatobacteraceae bacterium]|nr:acyl-CoA synthetase [Ilumatobacteraceae bacterium]
ELERRSVQLARVWRRAGLRAGDGVAILAENTPWFHEIYWAAIRSGLYLTPVNRHLSAPEVAYIVRDCGARAIVASANLVVVADAALHDNSVCAHRLVVGPATSDFLSYDTALAGESDEPFEDQPRGALMCYSSGTTGQPKGIRRALTGKQIDDPTTAASIDLFVDVFGIDASTRYLSPAPLYHAAPLAWTAAVQALGGTTVIMETFDARRALVALHDHRITHSQWVPTMFVRMLKLPAADRLGLDLSHHRCAIHAAAPCPPEVKRQMVDWWGPILWEFYAGSEGNGATIISSEEWLSRPGSVGRPLFGVVHVCDDDGTEVAVGETGLVYFELPGPAFVYHGDPDRTRDTRNPLHDRWTTIGDIGHVDHEGYLYLTDRRAFTIISGGVNIYPREIEDCLIMHPSIADVAVFGIPDADMGEAVHASIELARDVTPTADLDAALIAFARQRLAGFKVPRSIDYVKSLPRMPTGKLDKQPLRERYWRQAPEVAG